MVTELEPDRGPIELAGLEPDYPGEPTDGPQVRRDERGRLMKGSVLNPVGPLPKRETVPEKLKLAMERKADAIVAKAVERMLQTSAVGNRAFEDGLNRSYGTVAQKMEMVGVGQSSLYMFIADQLGIQLPGGSGESTLLPEHTNPG